MSKQITIEERRLIQLQMLDEFDAFCRKNNLRYSLAYGTLIGAIRHKGFIPWDDDVDLIMPMPDYIKLKKGFKVPTIKICELETEQFYEFPFPRIADCKTYKKTGLIATEYGVSIDLYLMIGISDDDARISQFFSKASRLLKLRQRMWRIRRRVIRFLPLKTIPFYSMVQKKYLRCIMEQEVAYDKANRYFAISGTPDYSCVFDYDLFKEAIDVSFESLTLMSTAYYDKFLTNQYGDYMKLPPEEDRHPYHGGNYRWRKD